MPTVDKSKAAAPNDRDASISFFSDAFRKIQSEGSFEAPPEVDENPPQNEINGGVSPIQVKPPLPSETELKAKARNNGDEKKPAESAKPSLASVFGMDVEKDELQEISPSEEDKDSSEKTVSADVEETSSIENEEILPTEKDKQHEAWKKTRKALKDQKAAVAAKEKELADLKLKVTELETKVPSPESLKEIEEIKAELDNVMYATKVERSRQYKQAVLDPLAVVQNSIKGFAEKYDLTEAAIVTAINDPDPKRESLSNLISDFSEFDKINMFNLSNEVTRLEQLDQAIKANAKEAAKKIEEQEEIQIKLERDAVSKKYASALTDYRKRVEESTPFLRRSDNEDWNKQLDSVEKFCSEIQPDQLSPEEKAILVTRAAYTPALLTLLNAVKSEYDKAIAKLAKYRKATPGAGRSGDMSPATSEEDDTLGFADIIKKKLNTR